MESSGGGRQRSSSFHEAFERTSSPVNLHAVSNVHHQTFTATQNVNQTSRTNVDRAFEYVTPQYHTSSNHPSEVLDISQLDEDGDEDENADENEDEIYSRGRTRSHSMHMNDNGVVPYPGNQTETLDSNQQSHSNEMKSFEKIERTGPLHQREVQALKKGLEQATPSRNREEILEEEQERKDAEAERLLRISVSNQHHNPAIVALNISDQIVRKVKLLLLGDSGVGKSSLILRWTMDTFSPTLVGTVGVNFKSKRIHFNSEPIQVQVWDTAGQEQFHKITTSYYRGANAIVLVYDVSDRRSLSNIEYWMKNIKSHASDSVHVVLVGNKTDLRSTDTSGMCVSTSNGKAVADKFGVPYFETSAKDSGNVDEAFMSAVRLIVAADVRLSAATETTSKVSVDKSKKMGLLDKLLKDKSKTVGGTALKEDSNNIRDKAADERCKMS